jgi:NADH-quinone oxidoreductase subunit H
MTDIVEAQRGMWFCVPQVVGLVIFLIAGLAETHRMPFDLPEAENELVAGYHSEYSGMKFAMFFLGEYVGITLISALVVTLFFGGYLIPFEPLLLGAIPSLEGSAVLAILQIITLMLKVSFFAFLFIWVRWTLPRFKYNQLMNLGWRYLLPISLANILVIAVGVAIYVALFG